MTKRLEIMLQGDGGITSHVFEDCEEVSVGRSSRCMLHIDHASVSRQHATFRSTGEGWTISDLGSSHGSWLNSRRLEEGEAAPIRPGDVIQIRPWSLIVRRVGSTVNVQDGDGVDGNLVRPTLEPLVQRRFAAFLEVVSSMRDAGSEYDIGDRIIQAVLRAADVDRAAIVQLVEEEIEVLAVRLQPNLAATTNPTPFSRTLVRAALSAGEAIRLDEYPEMMGAESIANAGVSQALCVPIDFGNGPEQVLYADAWLGGLDDGELVAWCDALARMHEIAIGNHRRDAAEAERSRLVGELDLARVAQELMLPERSGRHGPFTWAVSARPGHEVAGDLVDIACMADDSIGLLVGDVAGKGARAGLVMASIQAYAHAIRERGEGPNDLLEALDQWAEEVVPEDVFITLWCARLAADGTIRFIDAGHGMTYVVTSEGAVDRVAGPHRPPVGTGAITVDPSDLALHPGCTLIIMSDGLPEQPNNDGDRFGEARLEDLLRTTTDPESLVEAVRSWSERDSFEDDITVVAITFDPAPSD